MGLRAPGSRPVVLVFVKGLGIGGAERLISEAARFWDRDRFDYRVGYLLPWKDQLVGDLEGAGVPVTMLGGKRGSYPLSGLRLRRFIRDEKVHLVHAHLPSAGILARVFSSVPVVYTEHNLVASYRPLTRELNRLTYFRNRATTAVSPEVGEAVSGYRGPKVEVIENGVSVVVGDDEVAAVRDELGMQPGQPLVIHVGNIRPHKGHGNLVAAARWLADRGEDALLVSVGGEKYPGDLDRVRDLAREAGVEGTLRFLGRRTEARAFLAAADVVVNPSDFEGLPVSLLEAMALARPTVATAVGGVPGLIENEVSGLLVPPGDPAALGAAVVRLLGDRQLASDLAESGRRLVEARYGLAPMVRSFEELYLRVLASSISNG